MTGSNFTLLDAGIASVILLVDGALSIVLRLGIGRMLALAVARMIVQLVALGYLLRWIFALDHLWMTFAVVAVMSLAAAREAGARSRKKLARGYFVMNVVAVAGPALLTCLFALVTLFAAQRGWTARVIIPLTGILLGNILNSVSLGLAGVLEGVEKDAPLIEARLALGATFGESVGDLARQSIRRAIVPLVNQMSAAGIVTMPGIMTGQVLAGMDPLHAASYQIVLMLLLSGGSAMAAVVSVRMTLGRLTDRRQRLRLDRLRNA